ncbi:GNAT family N-acetyltransferase [Paenibacillus nanensis]|uniref:GNAT family N-acetyltransferase n=1 Tax=Paenibacillus nanensis TaxID=393251 RepID=A0A3A1UTG6_9BACL|nr:GNAT family N-acetyltransferase [Paenibacillus nanensis]RIX51544.1 GNAT family N-acetyltransferase [Paenibacillus nanensis]
MNRLYAKPCDLDKDYARFARFFIAHCNQFHPKYNLYDAIAHIITSVPGSRLMLFDDERGELAGYVHYRYDESGTTVFIDSTILISAYRSSRVFYRGFCEVIRQVMLESGGVRVVRFHALGDQAYLNRLYGKFAKRIGELESERGQEVVYETDFEALLGYLRLRA